MKDIDLKLLDRIFKLARKRGLTRLSLKDGQLEIGFELSEQIVIDEAQPRISPQGDEKPDAPPQYSDEELLMWSSGISLHQDEEAED